jgi:enoyl-CoA hydratase/carnithine racemase
MKRRLGPTGFGKTDWRGIESAPANMLDVRVMRLSPSHDAGFSAPLRRDDVDGVATLTLDSPASRNALSLAMLEALNGALAAIANEPKLRVVVITGAARTFSSGHDLREIAAHQNDGDGGHEYNRRLMYVCAQMMQAIVNLPKPVIAAVDGVASAAGCQLVATCDLAIAGGAARFALPGVNIGLFCSTPLVAVARSISHKHAMEMALTGALYSAEDAQRFGLINRIVPAGEALAQAQNLASALAGRSSETLAIGKKAFYSQIELTLPEAYAVASRAMTDNLNHADAHEGVAAFLEKRPPRWENQ